MGIERYLCVGGNEVANPNRTLAYMRSLGNRCQPTPPGAGCCECPDWEHEGTAPGPGITLETGIDVSDPDQYQVGTWSISNGLWNLTDQGLLQVEPCPLIRPPTPEPTDPRWADVMDGPLVLPMVREQPYGAPGPCEFNRATFTSETGLTFSVMIYIDYLSIAPGTVGHAAISFDQGETWQDFERQSWEVATTQTGGTFSTPADDDAPWYDPAVDASGDVLGVWIEEARLGTSFGRKVSPKLWGSTLGNVQAPGRELTMVGWCYTRSEAATAYARQWLFEALAGGCVEGCDLPDAEVWTHCNLDVPDEGRRLLKRVGLTSWDPDTDPTFPRACGFKFEAVLTSEVPHLVTAPFQVVDASLVAGDAICVLCSPCPTPDPQPITCGCMDTPLRVVPAPDVATCYCPPIQAFRQYIQVVPPRYWSDALAVITVETGDPNVPGGPGLANLRIRGWVNPVGLEPVPGEPNPFECQEPCLDVEVGCVPPRSTLVIDAATRKATVTADGRTFGAYGYLSSGGQRFVWPEVSCHGLVLAIDADAGQTPEAAKVRVEFVTRERG